jgi:hypothetical protein
MTHGAVSGTDLARRVAGGLDLCYLRSLIPGRPLHCVEGVKDGAGAIAEARGSDVVGAVVTGEAA